MGLFKWMKDLFKPSENDRNFWFFVQCDHCKEVLKGRVDLNNNLSIVYSESGEEVSYYCRKVMIGSKGCYRPIEVEFKFNSKMKLIDQQIMGGKFVTKEEYIQPQKS